MVEMHVLVTISGLAVFAAFLTASTAEEATTFTPGTIGNKLLVRYEFVPDLTHRTSHIALPRTKAEALRDAYAQVGRLRPDHTTLWCRGREYSVCLLLDRQGSIAGLQTSLAIADVKKWKLPYELADKPEWKRQTIFGIDVISATAYFVRKDVLRRGGRRISEDTLTAPDGLFFLHTDSQGAETRRLHLTNDEKDATAIGFYEQACFPAMGKHYLQGVSRTTASCSEMGAYVGLFNKSHKLHGFNFLAFGREPRIAGQRRYFENTLSFFLRMISPNTPQCLFEWTDKYGFFSMHVFFIDRPYYLTC